jgi:hypothetical protein
MIPIITTKLYSVGLLLDKNKSWKMLRRTVWCQYSVGSKPQEVITSLDFHCGLAGNTTHIGTKLWKVGFCRTTVVHRLCTPGCKARISYCTWFQGLLYNGIIDPEITCYSETWFTLYGYVNSQNNRYWSAGGPHTIHKVRLHDLKVGVQDVINAWRIIGFIHFLEILNSKDWFWYPLTNWLWYWHFM